MSKPPKIAPLVSFGSGVLTQQAIEAQEQQTQALVPSSVTAAWDYYTRTLGVTVPAHLNQARATSAHFLRLVR